MTEPTKVPAEESSANAVPTDKKTTEETKPIEDKKPTEETKPSIEDTKTTEETKPVEETKPTEETKPVEETKTTEETKPTEDTITKPADANTASTEPTTTEENIEAKKDDEKKESSREVKTESKTVDEEKLIEVGDVITLKTGIMFPTIKAQYAAFGTDEPIPLEKLNSYYKKHFKPTKSAPSTPVPVSKVTTEAKGTPNTEDTAPATKTDDGDNIVVEDDSKKPATEAPEKKEEKEPAEATAQVIEKKSTKVESNKALYNNLAHASVTGKGLLVYYKTKVEYENNEPLGIINLKYSEVLDSDNKGPQNFTIKTRVREYHFTTLSQGDKIKWTKSIKKRIEEAKSLQSVEADDKFKEIYQKLEDPDTGFIKLVANANVVTSDSEVLSSGAEEDEHPPKTSTADKRKTFGGFFSSIINPTSEAKDPSAETPQSSSTNEANATTDDTSKKPKGYLNLNLNNFFAKKSTPDGTTNETAEDATTTPDATDETTTGDKTEEKPEENVDDTARDAATKESKESKEKDSFINIKNFFKKKAHENVSSTTAPGETTTTEPTTAETTTAEPTTTEPTTAEPTTTEPSSSSHQASDKKEEEKVEEKNVEEKDKKPVAATSSENEDKPDGSTSPTSSGPIEMTKRLLSRSKTFLQQKAKKTDSARDLTTTAETDATSGKTGEETKTADDTTAAATSTTDAKPDDKKEETKGATIEETNEPVVEDSSTTPESPAASTPTNEKKKGIFNVNVNKFFKSNADVKDKTDGATTSRNVSEDDKEILQHRINDDAKKHGELFKVSQILKKPNKQYFVLSKDGTLFYVSNKKEKHIDLTGAKIKKYESKEKTEEKEKPEEKEKTEEKEKSEEKEKTEEKGKTEEKEKSEEKEKPEEKEKHVEKDKPRHYLEIDSKLRSYKLFTEDKQLRDEWHDALNEAILSKGQKEESARELPAIKTQSDGDFTNEVVKDAAKAEEKSSQEKSATKTDETTDSAPVDPKVEKTDVISPEPKSESESKTDTTEPTKTVTAEPAKIETTSS